MQPRIPDRRHRAPSGMTVNPLAAGGRLVRPTRPKTLIWLSHAHSPARFRRPRTRFGVEDRGLPAGDETLVRAGQCRHRAGSRMRGARYRRPSRGDRFLQAQRGGFRRGRPGCADRGGHRRRSRRGRLQGVRADQGGGAARKLEELHQGAVPRESYSDRGLRALHRRARRRRPISASRARRSSSRPTGSPPARAWWWR